MKDARICNGDTVFIKKTDVVNNGEIAAVIINDEATLKRVYYYPESNKLMLLPENSNYEPIVYVGEELEKIHIIGRAVAFKSDIR
jgi:repressor LexA